MFERKQVKSLRGVSEKRNWPDPERENDPTAKEKTMKIASVGKTGGERSRQGERRKGVGGKKK